jgi:DNA-binding MarR family transcriptional regulator
VTVATSDARVVAEAVEGLIAALVHQRRPGRDPEPGTLSTFQGLTLSTLVDQGPARLGSVADTLGTTDATASRTIDALEARGLAERQADPDDARCVIVLATHAGVSEVRRRRKQLTALAARALEGLSEEEAHRVAASLAELQTLLDRR